MTTDKMTLKLETMIDKPMRKSVAMFNLLGIKTIWSCCGFDYRGQESWRKHTVGFPQFLIDATPRAFEIMVRVLDDDVFANTNEWVTHLKKFNCQHIAFMVSCNYDRKHNWDNSVHYHERMVVAIQRMENKLLEFKDEFLEHAIISDTNESIKKTLPHWDFPSSENWEFTKDQIIKM